MTREFGFKLVLIGDGRVGKTSIRRKFMGRHFETQHLMTLGADFSTKTIEIPLNNLVYNVTFSIWDIAGQDSFKAVRQRFYGKTKALLLVFDVTDKQSFDNLLKWLYEAWEITSDFSLPLIIIGNKIDLVESRKIRTDTIYNFVQALQKKYPKIKYCSFMETSALTGQNVEKLFLDIGTVLLQNSEPTQNLTEQA